jgi:hypothetical protein
MFASMDFTVRKGAGTVVWLLALWCTACGAPTTAPRDSSPASAADSAADSGAESASESVAESAMAAAAEAGAEAEELSAAARALDQLSSAYDDLAALVDRNPGEAVQWAQDDIENLGDWEYRIEEYDAGLPTPDLQAQLNALGEERWEVFWMEATPAGVRVYLKRSSISYLSRLPLSALVRLLSGGGQ